MAYRRVFPLGVDSFAPGGASPPTIWAANRADGTPMPHPLPPCPRVPDPDPSTSLERSETNVGSDARCHQEPWHPQDRYWQHFRHSGWATQRYAVWRALNRVGTPRARLQAFQECGAAPQVYVDRDDPTNVRISGSYCKSRFCVPCASARARTIRANLVGAFPQGVLRFVTLTLNTKNRPLHDELKRLIASFRKLRASGVMHGCFRRGASFIEVKWSRRAKQWHPHIHILVQGRYIPQKVLSDTWLKITGDSRIVDVRMVRNSRIAERYITKYVTKGIDHTVWTEPRLLDEAILALKGRRLCTTFGDLRGLKLTENPSDVAWEHLFPLATLLNASHAGNRHAALAIAGAQGDFQHPEEPLVRPPPNWLARVIPDLPACWANVIRKLRPAPPQPVREPQQKLPLKFRAAPEF